MKRVWRVLLMVAVLCLGAGAIAGGATAKPAGKPATKPAKSKAGAAGELDAKFSKDGKVTVAFPAENAGSTGPRYSLPFEFTPGHLQMVQAPGGKLVVAGAGKIVQFLANGEPDTSFGVDGVVTVPRPPGAVFVLAGAAVDSQGRIVLAGLARPVPTNSTPDPVLSSAAVMRFTPTGSLDTSFGSGGMVISTLGLTAPKGPGGTYPGASVGLRDVVIDSQNRIVVTGGYVNELAECSRYVNSKGFVARLTEAGALDTTFGEGGIRTISTLATIGQIAPSRGGYLALASGGPLCKGPEGPGSLITGFDENGNLNSTFGSFGFRTLPFGYESAPAVAIAPSGKIVLLGRPENRHYDKKVKKVVEGKKVVKSVRVNFRVQTVQRLLGGGAADPSFGRVGRISFRDPKSGSLSALTVDKLERIYMVGRIGQRVSKSRHNPLHRTTFLVQRTNPDGTYDRSFGQRGSVVTGFGGPTSSFATQVMLDTKGRILVGGGLISPNLPTGGGYAIARYLPGS
jgi:uncharacterized delta-60 repeat protein